MGRQRRSLCDGGVYHIVKRGHNKDRLFRKAGDYTAFKSFIRQHKKKYVFDIFHYCLIPNHFHLLIKVSIGDDLPKIMHGITQLYSYHYRKTYRRVGYVYQNRYKHFPVENDSYLLECGRYIERNPLRAGAIKDPAQYEWSSCKFYANGKSDDMITEDPLYKDMGRTPEERRCRYREYILEARPYEQIVDRAMMR